jgi:nicotinamidase/pyrazinamidase
MTMERVQEIPGARELIRYIRGELRYFRERDRPVIFTCRNGSARRSLLPELTPRLSEPVLFRHTPSAFFGTELDELLPPSTRRLTLVGVDTPTSILLTAADAYARGFEVVVPEPCVCAEDPAEHAFAMRLIRERWHPWGLTEREPLPLSEEGRAILDEGEPA